MTETATKVAMAMNTAVEACDKVVDQAGPTEILNDVIAKQLGV
jgi:hypothetical protein